MLTYEEREKLMNNIIKNREDYKQKVNEITSQTIELQTNKKDLEEKVLNVYKAGMDKDGLLHDYRQQIKQLEGEIQLKEKEIDALEPLKKEIEQDTMQLLDAWIELSNQGKRESMKILQKANELQEEVDALKNEADIHHAQATKYAQQVRQWAEFLPKEHAQGYINFQ